ncbi:Protein of unknown function [Anaerobranca californiensis DSM 14826]|jgi:hypothetical protein|uniref:DUF1653 domain-containing protein n=1 Tax=Anaerobranca californiensis DSM 14826 TaxID=1120989 RepID=A0A1M6LE07_9FIRM|nr:DUF1653 domain-containing protein [Anaerobranca californiensis]SHJ69443.1 Protein of unknown function [Anaerobranca californiensis DSM 14826]
MSIIVGGRYRHYKGKEYQVLHIGKHTETLEELVVYKCLYGDYSVWVRPKKMFEELVEIEGKKVPRFSLIKENNDLKGC